MRTLVRLVSTVTLRVLSMMRFEVGGVVFARELCKVCDR